MAWTEARDEKALALFAVDDVCVFPRPGADRPPAEEEEMDAQPFSKASHGRRRSSNPSVSLTPPNVQSSPGPPMRMYTYAKARANAGEKGGKASFSIFFFLRKEMVLLCLGGEGGEASKGNYLFGSHSHLPAAFAPVAKAATKATREREREEAIAATCGREYCRLTPRLPWRKELSFLYLTEREGGENFFLSRQSSFGTFSLNFMNT